jgi:hypothetical protein
MDDQVCAIKDCVSFRDAEPSTYRNVNWALFSSGSKSNSPFQNAGLLANIVAYFIGQSLIS